MPTIAETPAEVILGEATIGTPEERYEDMRGIASVMANRAAMTGSSLESIVSAKGQFDAYGRALPTGTESLRGLAERALTDVLTNGPAHGATFYATPSAVKNLPSGLSPVAKTKGHRYFEDPKGRPIITAEGAKKPVIQTPATGPIPETRPTTREQTFSHQAQTRGYDARGIGALAPNGLSFRNPAQGLAGLGRDAVLSAQVMGANLPGGATITSGYRDSATNKDVGGAERSQHMKGNAYDVSLRGMNEAERAKAVEMARMSGATRIGAYSGNTGLHVDFAKGYPPTNGGVYAMFDESNRNMGRAPNWFTQGLEQVTVPTPTSRPARSQPPAAPGMLASAQGPSPSRPDNQRYGGPSGTQVSREQVGLARQTPASAPVPTAAPRGPSPSPSRPDNNAYSGPNVTAMNADRRVSQAFAPTPSRAPVPTYSQDAIAGRIAQAHAQPAGLAAAARAAQANARVAQAHVPAPMGLGVHGPVGPAPAETIATAGLPGPRSPSRPDNLNYQGPKGLGGPGGLYLAPPASLAAALPANKTVPRDTPLPPAPSMAANRSRPPAVAKAAPLSPPRTIENRPVHQAQIPTPTPAPRAAPSGPPRGYDAIAGAFAGPAGTVGLSRSNPEISFTSLGDGRVERTNSRYGTSYVMGPGDWQGPRSSQTISAPKGKEEGSRRGWGLGEGLFGQPTTRSGAAVRGGLGTALGGIAGGFLVGGPLGGIVGGLIGRELAMGRNPFDRTSPSSLTTALDRMNSQTPGWGGWGWGAPRGDYFPPVPQAPASGSTPSYSAADLSRMGDLSPNVTAAIAAGRGGLY